VSCIVAPDCPFGRPGFCPDLPRSDFGTDFASPSGEGGLEEFREFAFTRAARSATRDCSPAKMLSQHRDLRILLRYPRVPLHQQLPRPRVRSAEARIAVGNAGCLGHAPPYTTTLLVQLGRKPEPSISGERSVEVVHGDDRRDAVEDHLSHAGKGRRAGPVVLSIRAQ
jgi:hypothetical protein